MKILGALLLSLLLAACGGSPAPAPPGPTPTPRPGVLAFTASWQAPLGAAAYCGGDLSSPFECALPAGATWGVLKQDGNGGLGCVDPQPNLCFDPENGVLNYSSGNPGMALISARTFSIASAISVRSYITATNDCSGPASFVGPSIYDGEGDKWDPSGNYRVIYLSCAGGSQPQAWVYGPTYAGPLAATTYAQGSTHALRIDWIPGVSFTYFVDDFPVAVETTNLWSADPLSFNQSPHFAIYFGISKGQVGASDVFTGS